MRHSYRGYGPASSVRVPVGGAPKSWFEAKHLGARLARRRNLLGAGPTTRPARRGIVNREWLEDELKHKIEETGNGSVGSSKKILESLLCRVRLFLSRPVRSKRLTIWQKKSRAELECVCSCSMKLIKLCGVLCKLVLLRRTCSHVESAHAGAKAHRRGRARN